MATFILSHSYYKSTRFFFKDVDYCSSCTINVNFVLKSELWAFICQFYFAENILYKHTIYFVKFNKETTLSPLFLASQLVFLVFPKKARHFELWRKKRRYLYIHTFSKLVETCPMTISEQTLLVYREFSNLPKYRH